MGLMGRPAGALLETLPLRLLYRRSRFVCVSRATQDGVVAHGVPRERTTVSYNGGDTTRHVPGRRAATPEFLVLGRLKRYKRVERVLDAFAGVQGAHLHIAGDGDHAEALREAVGRRGLGDRVTFHGHVD